MFCRGSNGSRTFSSSDTAGINCISPCAPARETANGLNADSARMIARIRLGSSRYRSAASAIAALYATVGETGRKSADVDTNPSDVLIRKLGVLATCVGNDI